MIRVKAVAAMLGFAGLVGVVGVGGGGGCSGMTATAEGNIGSRTVLAGLDHLKLTFKFQGRNFRLTDVAGDVIHKLIV